MKVEFQGGSLDAAVQAADERKRERDAVVEQAEPANIDRLDPAALKRATPPATREFDCGALSGYPAKLATEATTVIKTSERRMVEYAFTMSASPRNNAAKTRAGMPPGRPFQHGNPGRPKGSRNKLSEAFLDALHADWQEHGADVIAKVRQDRPHDYLKVVASTLPKDLNVRDARASDLRELSDEALAAIILNGESDAPENRK